MHIKLKDHSKIEIPDGSSAKDVAAKLNLTKPDQALGACINSITCDLNTRLNDGDQVTFWNFNDREGKEMFWHTSAHVLAQAILRLWPEAKPTIGPPIENGFYYDFADLTISDADFEKIEKEMEAITSANFVTEQKVFGGKAEALKCFHNNKYKIELIESFGDSVLTGYQQGEFFDLCRGPHIPNVGKIKAVKVLKTAGAYWRGDQKNEMLTRIYAITFPETKALKEYLTLLEEAKKRDHKILGPKYGIFTIKDEAPGIPFILPRGMVIWNKLLEYWRECHGRADYIEIKTPQMLTRDLWETSGHWQNYRDSMYTLSVDEKDYAIKPMNCPGCMLYYRGDIHSYRELPLRIAEIGNVHRNEASGAISGLFRTRGFHQDDAHIFMQPSDIEKEILKVLALVDEIYGTFGLSYHLELSTRPEKNTIGSDEDWKVATDGLKQALDSLGRDYRINEGDGAFYGPKIDIHIRDALGRTWQCGTIQLDMALPEKFQLEYTASDGSRPRPVMIHRVIFGSIERFLGILIEHFAGRFPFWLSPQQIRLIPVAETHKVYAHSISKECKQAGFLCSVDDSNEKLGKKIREAQVDQVNYMLTIGDRELEKGSVALRTRNGTQLGELKLEEFLSKITKERSERSLHSPFDPSLEKVPA